MNASRIEIATTLPEPHFDDESTIVTARQVVPLDLAKTEDRRRKVLRLLPLLLAATLCGALGAVAVNYFDRRENISSAGSQPPTANTQVTQQPSPAQDSVASSNIQPPTADESSETAPQPEETSAVSSDAKSADNQPAEKKTEETVRKKAPSPEPKQLVRPRRVNAQKDAQSAKRPEAPKAGAGRIQDIFGSPNP